MSDPGHDHVEQPVEGEVRHLPVPAPVVQARPIERTRAGELQHLLASLPAPGVAAAGGFVMGIVTWVAVRVLRRGRSSALPARRRGRRGVEVAATRSFIVDVHLLKDR